jgi:hypothetical protein
VGSAAWATADVPDEFEIRLKYSVGEGDPADRLATGFGLRIRNFDGGVSIDRRAGEDGRGKPMVVAGALMAGEDSLLKSDAEGTSGAWRVVRIGPSVEFFVWDGDGKSWKSLGTAPVDFKASLQFGLTTYSGQDATVPVTVERFSFFERAPAK